MLVSEIARRTNLGTAEVEKALELKNEDREEAEEDARKAEEKLREADDGDEED